MSMTIDQILKETRSWPPHAVAELLDRILLMMQTGQDAAHTAAWSTTVQRRVAEIRTGLVPGVPGPETSAKIRKIVGRQTGHPSNQKAHPHEHPDLNP